MVFKEIPSKTIISASKIYDNLVNPYMECQHACYFCYAHLMKKKIFLMKKISEKPKIRGILLIPLRKFSIKRRLIYSLSSNFVILFFLLPSTGLKNEVKALSIRKCSQVIPLNGHLPVP